MSATMSPESRLRPDPSMRPTNVRRGVLWAAITLGIVTYIDRVAISQAAPLMTEELGFSSTEMGWAFAAFAWGYALFEVPGGWLGDWLGARKVLTRIVIWWSAFTAFTGMVWNIASLVVVRFLFGAGEAGCFPNLTKMFSAWLPRDERARAQSIMWMSARWGGAITPQLVAWTLLFVNWRQTFYVFAALGIVWAVIFVWWYRDKPSEHPSINAAELALLQDAEENAVGNAHVPWSKLVRSGNIWLLWAQYFCVSWGWYFYITWLPTYLKNARGLELAQSALLAGLPLFLGGIGCLLSAYLVKFVAGFMGGDISTARRWVCAASLTAAAGLLLAAAHLDDPVFAMIAMGLSSFTNDLTVPAAWSTCMDIGGRFAGSVSGSMNMMGNLAGGLAPVAVGYILAWSDQDWNLALFVSVAIYFMAAICWFLIDSNYRIDRD
jgi:ACS family glucarate transporter-like MFS transporter